jgi:fatty acid desaturase
MSAAARLYGPPPPEMPIPDRLNVSLVAAVFASATVLLLLAGRLGGGARLATAVVFSYVGLTAYALLHEAAHDNLHSDPRWNRALGVIAGLLFPVPFSAVRTTHQGHHLRNRTDYEMFDLYYARDNRWLKRAQWYGTLCGLFWPLVPLGAILVAVFPPVLRLPLFTRLRSTAYLLGDIREDEVKAIRVEVLAIAVFLGTVLWLSAFLPQGLLLCYACFGLNWSTRQYVGHAFTRRHVIEGALNLRQGRLMTLVLLHGEYDLNHHRRPDVPWPYLPALSPAAEARPSYLRQYLRMWRGPRLTAEPAPERGADVRLSVHA